jgi:hypothetical protein
MPATVLPLPHNSTSETVDFLRRMASMISGGRNGEMLLHAAAMIESLTRRAVSAEQLYHDQQDESARNVERREVAELATDNLLAETEALRKQLADIARLALQERGRFEEESRRLRARAADAEARLAETTAELDELRASVDAFSESVIAVPIEALRLARAQFDFLAEGFARNGDVISRTICEIGGCTIDQALTSEPPTAPGSRR